MNPLFTKRMKSCFVFLMIIWSVFTLSSCQTSHQFSSISNSSSILESESQKTIEVNHMNLKIKDQLFNVILENNETTKALVKMLPLTINMNELNGNEKYYYLSNTLPTNTSRVTTIHAGDVMLYGNNCLVIFYKSFETSYSYTKIGHIEDISNLAFVLGDRDVQVNWSI